MRRSNIPILLVEDDLVDAKTVRRAFERRGISNPLVVVETGEEALKYLDQSQTSEAEAPRPGLVLLDINLPGISGFEVLEAMKRDAGLRRIPVVVLTTSDHEPDRQRGYSAGAAGYVTKPVSFEAFSDAIETVDRYWTLCESCD